MATKVKMGPRGAWGLGFFYKSFKNIKIRSRILNLIFFVVTKYFIQFIYFETVISKKIKSFLKTMFEFMNTRYTSNNMFKL